MWLIKNLVREILTSDNSVIYSRRNRFHTIIGLDCTDRGLDAVVAYICGISCMVAVRGVAIFTGLA